MDAFAKLPPAERAEVFTETAARMGLAAAVIVEKDFWAAWTLKRLFALKNTPKMIFKGGTSLSKAYGVINRFSEDIDISLDREALGFAGEHDPGAEGLSNTHRKRLLEALREAASDYVAGELRDAINANIVAALGENGWTLAVDEADSQTLLFAYPRALDNSAYAGLAYVPPQLRLEMGARADHWPAAEREIRSYVADEFPDLFSDEKIAVTTLGVERTFWEKVTILHAAYHAAADKALAARVSRHYYDVALLADSEFGAAAIADKGLLEAVTLHKSRFFPSAAARYDEAHPGTLRLAPHDSLEKLLRADYEKMAEMIFGEPPPFDEILATLRKIEASINK